MHPRERLMGMARRLQMRGEPIPLDMLAEAERLGLSLSLFNEPTHNIDNNDEGDNNNEKYEKNLHNAESSGVLPLPDEA
jgi:hypothetical protein